MLCLLLICVCLVLFVVQYRKRKHYWMKDNILQTDDLIWTFLFDKRSMAEICKTLYDKYDTPHIGTFIGLSPTLILKNPEDIEAVLAGEFENFSSRGIQTNPNDILANNLLFISDYKRWRILRERIKPVYKTIMLKNMFYILEKCARDLVELVEDNKYVRQKPFNVLYTYTSATIGATVIGTDTQSKNSTMDSPFLDMSWKSLKPSLGTNIKIFIAKTCPKLFKMLKLKLFEEHEEFFIGIVKNVLRSRNRIEFRFDFIEICLQLQLHGIMQDFHTGYELGPTDNILAAQAFSFFIAGADTTANALHFTLIELVNNQDILSKLHEEIDSVFGKYKEELSYSDIDNLQYLDMIISESLRKYPPIALIQRLCTKDTVLPSKVTIKKDTKVVIPVFAIHRDEKYYPNPDVFDPERFRNFEDYSKMKYTYLSFGEGNRSCVGRKFARHLIKIALAWLLRRFTLTKQNYTPKFERSTYALRDSEARYQLVVRDIFTE